MATISSVGIGSGLDVKSIVSQLVALEKQPLTALKVTAASFNTKISAFAEIKSLASSLSTAASTLNSLTTWNAVAATSSDSTSVSVSAIGGTLPTTFNVEVQSLAKAKSTASAALATGVAVGGGTLTLTIGTGTPVEIAVSNTDTVTDIASTINGAGAGVTATVLSDASGDRLLLRSTATGLAGAFTLAVTAEDGVPLPTTELTDRSGLSRLVVGTISGTAPNEVTEDTLVTQAAADARATVNGIAVSSSTNTFASTISGVTFNALKVTTASVEINVTKDKSVVQTNIDAFVKAYNDMNTMLQDLTKYDSSTKSAGLLQGDSTTVGLQRALRGVLQSVTTGSAYGRLADIGITQQLGGALAVDSTKLTAALNNGDEAKKLFTVDNNNELTNGVALKFKTFAAGLLATDGFFTSKDASLKRSLDANTKDQQRVNEKAARIEAALNRRYSALDAQMASLTALNAYVTQQVTQWNKSTA